MKNETIKKINTYAPYVILLILVFTFDMSILGAVCLGVVVGVISAFVNAYYETKD